MRPSTLRRLVLPSTSKSQRTAPFTVLASRSAAASRGRITRTEPLVLEMRLRLAAAIRAMCTSTLPLTVDASTAPPRPVASSEPFTFSARSAPRTSWISIRPLTLRTVTPAPRGTVIV